ncbi:DUF1801 domain-containing protein [Brevundimonas sp. AJA228-03]|uniref:DUF1801 domain-containing protein n=1 Tax=Brevundimonas sp. AJA228-03 TaxID=2752515 RepID=UPI001AE074AB|nr:DUF1801 domain-containing protein [Brevundimonas sp. AJA228-03]QTN18184.1 DUF1801 domain-containing protein [Brevundimonas sp. AJA228-03]
MAEAKPRPTAVSVEDFIAAVEDPRRREDAAAVVALLARATGLAPTMWGSSIIGFGRYHYRYDSGHEGDAPLVGFAPRKANLVFYMAAGEAARADVLSRLGKHKTGKGCVYVNRLSDIDPDVLVEMARGSIETLQARYPA